jgi:phosphoglycerol geranylgeranyltransferase
VTAENTEETMTLVAATGAPTLHEPSGAGHVTEQTRDNAELLAIPEVLNGDSEALVGTLGKGLDYVRGELGPGLVEDRIGIPLSGDGLVGERAGNFAAAYLMREAIFEAYIIMNPDSAAAREASVTESELLSPEAARERALAAEYHLESEVVYLEYSGTFGGEEAVAMLEELDDALSSPRVWYGGGLDSAAKAETVLDAGADAVVVGDVFHDIADVEAGLVEQARERFDEVPGHEQLVDWVAETADVGETSAMRYLSTIPEVADAEETGTAYLAAGVEFALAVDAIATGLTDPGAERVAEALREDSRLPETALAELLDGTQSELPRRVAAALLAERFDVDIADAFAARHLGVELPV